MSPAPDLTVRTPSGDVAAVALVLHGGRQHSTAITRANQLAVLRMVPIARALQVGGRRHGLAVARLRFAVRGWNGTEQSPVADARWALEQLSQRFPDRPVAIVGHSMGGRTAIAVAGHPSVTTIVGLAPWLERTDPTNTVAGRRVLLAHGSLDRITDPRRSARFVSEVAPITRSATFVSIEGDRHAMLGRPRVWNALTTGYVLAALCDVPPSGSAPGETTNPELTNVLTQALAGQAALVV